MSVALASTLYSIIILGVSLKEEEEDEEEEEEEEKVEEEEE